MLFSPRVKKIASSVEDYRFLRLREAVAPAGTNRILVAIHPHTFARLE
jgi:hypothetical protein